jgi:hypothetical protein
MPSPLVHVYIAQLLLTDSNGQGLAHALRGQVGDFLLGSIAPDAWTLGRITRQQAHVLPIPIPPGKEGAVELLAVYPTLADPARLTPASAAFVAGYMAHLLVDEIWYHGIFHPCFYCSAPTDPPLARRLVLHNVLRLHCEVQIEDQLDAGLVGMIFAAAAAYAFPLLDDDALRQWRDLVGAELQPGVPKRSAEVFAERLGIPVEELLTLLRSPAIIEQEIMGRLPAGQIDRFMSDSVAAARILVDAYLNRR